MYLDPNGMVRALHPKRFINYRLYKYEKVDFCAKQHTYATCILDKSSPMNHLLSSL